MIGWMIALSAVAAVWLIGWSLCRMAALGDAEEAQRELLALLAEQAADRAIANNLDI